MAIINSTDSDYASRLQGIRLFVNNAYSQEDLPDATIENDIYLGAANREVARLVPSFASLAEENQADIKVAVQELTAAEILQSELDATQEESADVSVRRQGLKVENRMNSLRISATTKINRIAPAAETDESIGVVYETL